MNSQPQTGLILGIETSCDETSVALVGQDGAVHVNLIASQIPIHRPYGGVVPEIASREHLEQITPLMRRAFSDGGFSLDDLSAVAVTAGPGLIGALLVGVAAAQGLAYGRGIPLVAVNHLEGHIFSPYLRSRGPAERIPARFLSLVVSGGHSSLYDVTSAGVSRAIAMRNRTRDDAAGEVFDKVAKFIGLPYPGGPEVDRIARQGKVSPKYSFSLPRFKEESIDFSFSGLKAMAIRMAREEGFDRETAEGPLADFCASFQEAICDQIIDRLTRLWDELGAETNPPTELALAGGVAANGVLRQRVTAFCETRGLISRLPEKVFCTDNGAMIAFAALQGNPAAANDPKRVTARSRMPVGS